MISSLLLLFFVAVADLTSCAIVETRQTSTDSHVQRNLNTIKSIYNLTVYPHNVPIIQQGASAVPPGLFDPSATGRITPLGNFTGFEDSIEYFFGLAPVPQNSAGSAIFKSEVVEFTSGCPEVASSVVYLYVGQVNQTTGELVEGAKVTPLKQIAFWRFDDQGLVNKYDAWIPTLQLWTTTSSGIDYSNPLVQANVPAMALCPTIQKNCQGIEPAVHGPSRLRGAVDTEAIWDV
ncbi:hypothetical protein AAF712_013041 [Marasmius tenuissimus]|uniref:Uncharacterized protein n=1 Tax=Marasmius tenuissimus TaxID=585030 RepID=A0ABR2ZGY6_9AGAR